MNTNPNEMKKTEEMPDRRGGMKSMYVTGCKRLNIREEPNGDATVLKVVPEGDRVLVYGDYMNETYYQVRINKDTRGYAMKKYLTERT